MLSLTGGLNLTQTEQTKTYILLGTRHIHMQSPGGRALLKWALVAAGECSDSAWRCRRGQRNSGPTVALQAGISPGAAGGGDQALSSDFSAGEVELNCTYRAQEWHWGLDSRSSALIIFPLYSHVSGWGSSGNGSDMSIVNLLPAEPTQMGIVSDLCGSQRAGGGLESVELISVLLWLRPRSMPTESRWLAANHKYKFM